MKLGNSEANNGSAGHREAGRARHTWEVPLSYSVRNWAAAGDDYNDAISWNAPALIGAGTSQP